MCSRAAVCGALLSGFPVGHILPLTEPVIALAERIGPATLRSLDAIHLASASWIARGLTAFVSYDHRLLDGCRDVGLTAASPGAVR